MQLNTGCGWSDSYAVSIESEGSPQLEGLEGLNNEEDRKEDGERDKRLCDRKCEKPLLVWERQALHELGKPFHWIDAHVGTHEEAQSIIGKLRRAEWKLTWNRGDAKLEEVDWLCAEVPPAHVDQRLLQIATDSLRQMEQVLQLPPVRVHWLEELGPTVEVSQAELSALCQVWNCDLATLEAEYLHRRTVTAQCDPEVGLRRTSPDEFLGGIDPDEPDAITLSAEHLQYDDWKEPDHDTAPYEKWSEDVLDRDYEAACRFAPWEGTQTVHEVVAYCARNLWQHRHFKQEILDDIQLRATDAQIFYTLTVSRSAYARIRGRQWFDEFVERHEPFMTALDAAEPEPEHEAGSDSASAA